MTDILSRHPITFELYSLLKREGSNVPQKKTYLSEQTNTQTVISLKSYGQDEFLHKMG